VCSIRIEQGGNEIIVRPLVGVLLDQLFESGVRCEISRFGGCIVGAFG
jgi:hypothetical protein